MNGAFLNALGILLGSLAGLVWRAPVSKRFQMLLRSALGAATMASGAWLILSNLGPGFLIALKRLLIMVLALLLGYWVGKILRLQKMSNWLGRHASRRITAAQAHPPDRAAGGLLACVALFGAAPLGWLGAVQDGFTGQSWLMGVKAVMDALAMTGFVQLFGWPAALSAFPVFALFGGVTLACQRYAVPFCAAHQLADSVAAATGMVACVVSIVIFEVRRVELASYLPALVIAPLIEWWWGGGR